MLIFDIETNGLLDVVNRVHCLHMFDTSSGQFSRYDREQVPEGVKRLQEADCICGHNIIFFDIPALKKVYPWFTFKKTLDTLVWSRLAYADIKDSDLVRAKRGQLPKKLIGSHSLAAYGYRMGILKGDFCEETDWQEWSQEMSDYCLQDVVVTKALYARLVDKNISFQAIELEHQVAFIIQRQIANGFGFDVEAAQDLYGRLVQRKAELREKLALTFHDWTVQLPDFIPKKDNKVRGYKKGVPVPRFKTIEFNPSSRDHIAYQLKTVFGWTPTEFTDGGKPKIDEDILLELPYPEAKDLVEYFIVEKRLGQLGDGENAWLKMVKDGKIHGDVITNGAVTGRMTHNHPNVAQTPAVRVPYGKECRSLFRPTRPGWKQVGADASGLELRCLAHYMARYDGGAYAHIILNGDIHTANQKAAGLATRDQAKTFIYAFLYGAGDEKIGEIVGKGAEAGKKLKKQFLAATPAIRLLTEAVQRKAKERGYLIGLDGRELKVRSQHSALNLLLQSAGAVVMKQALVILDQDLQAIKLTPSNDYEFMVNCHDEWQIETKEDLTEIVGKTAVEAIRKAGEHFGFRCPLDGEYKVGNNWAECH